MMVFANVSAPLRRSISCRYREFCCSSRAMARSFSMSILRRSIISCRNSLFSVCSRLICFSDQVNRRIGFESALVSACNLLAFNGSGGTGGRGLCSVGLISQKRIEESRCFLQNASSRPRCRFQPGFLYGWRGFSAEKVMAMIYRMCCNAYRGPLVLYGRGFL